MSELQANYDALHEWEKVDFLTILEIADIASAKPKLAMILQKVIQGDLDYDVRNYCASIERCSGWQMA